MNCLSPATQHGPQQSCSYNGLVFLWHSPTTHPDSLPLCETELILDLGLELWPLISCIMLENKKVSWAGSEDQERAVGWHPVPTFKVWDSGVEQGWQWARLILSDLAGSVASEWAAAGSHGTASSPHGRVRASLRKMKIGTKALMQEKAKGSVWLMQTFVCCISS